MKPEDAAKLREPFPASAIGKLPKAGIQLDFVGHAAVTDRLLQVDPEWSWEPFSVDEDGLPKVTVRGKDAVMWIRLTVAGVTRPGVGIAPAGSFELEKQLISDALRNGAMRFGVALDLWSREDLNAGESGSTTAPASSAPSHEPPQDHGEQLLATEAIPENLEELRPSELARLMRLHGLTPQGDQAEMIEALRKVAA